MVKIVQHGVDKDQIKKAIKALLAFHRNKNANSLLLNEHDQLLLMITVWKIPNQAKVIRIPLPHGIRQDTSDVCLFTRDEPNMSTDQTERFYKKLLSQNGVKQITEVIPLKKMKKEYKQFEAKRRLLSSFDVFLADARIRRLLPSHIGKHFYKEKREPDSVNLKHNNLAAELNRHIQGTRLHINTRGCCYSVRVGHIGMKVEDIVENTIAIARVIAEKLPQKWKNVKVLHLKTQSSVALPIYTSSFDSIEELKLLKTEKAKAKKKKSAKESKPVISGSEQNGDHIAEEKEDIKKSAKESKPATSGSEETGAQIVEAKKDTKKSAKKTKPATLGSKDQIAKKKNDTKKSAKKRKPATSGSGETGAHIAEEKKDTASPHKGKKKPDVEEEEIPQLIPIQEPSSAKRRKKKEIVVQEESKVEEKGKRSEENEEVPSNRKSTLRKRKMNESEEVIKTPSKPKIDLASKEKSEQPEKQETPPKRSVYKKTPKKTPGPSAVKLTKSARKAPQTPKLRQKKKMKTPQSA